MQNGQTHHLQPKKFYYTYGPNEPALSVKNADIIVALTRDARGYDKDMNPITDDLKQKSDVTEYCESNPLVGPIFVEDADLGDTLAIHIERIALNRPSAWSRLRGRFGSFTGEGPGKLMLFNEPLPEIRYDWQLDLDRMTGMLELPNSRIKKIEIPLHPFIGSVGVAPRFGRVDTALTPGEYGGNMDCVETKERTTLYLPVWVKGAFLEFGDIHAAQGDGEVCGIALETTAEVTIRVEVVKGWHFEWPRLEDETHIMVAASARPLMDAMRLAYFELVEWLVKDYGFDRWEAFQVVSQVATMRVGNVVDPNYTLVVKFPKQYLG